MWPLQCSPHCLTPKLSRIKMSGVDLANVLQETFNQPLITIACTIALNFYMLPTAN